MADDLVMVDSQSTRMPNNMNAFDFQGFSDDNYGLANISTASRPNETGSRLLLSPSTSLSTQPPFLETGGTFDDI
jgi:hypothetical protein